MNAKTVDVEAPSPYHPGEQAAQEMAGTRLQAERLGRHMIRAEMPDQHRIFFEQLPYLFIGSLDVQGRPWAAMLSGEPGFARSPDPATLTIRARPVPAVAPVSPGAQVGLLGIELHTRRRNRLNGHVTGAGASGITIAVDQSFGNCPQYIQARDAEPIEAQTSTPAPRPEGALLSDRAAALVAAADTFFIATASARPDAEDPRQGVDLSHRGGNPGFVLVANRDGRTVLVAPDFRGNNMFNTFGNLAVNPRAGLLFPDFATGALLALTGTAQVLWDDPAIAQFQGAKRLLSFAVDEGLLLESAMPFRWSVPEPAPQLVRTGRWLA